MSTGSNGCVWISTLLLQLSTALHIGMWRIVERRPETVWSISALPNNAANLVQQLLFQALERDGEVDDRHLWNFRSLTCQEEFDPLVKLGSKANILPRSKWSLLLLPSATER